MDLNKIINKGIENILDKDPPNEKNNILRGSNTPLFIDGKFIATESAHCPRVAILRSKYGITEPRSKMSLISNETGRNIEVQFKNWLKESNIPNFEYKEEEEAQIELKNEQGDIIFTARPDYLFKYNNELAAAELKSIQSGSTFLKVFKYNEPKDGAIIQIANYLFFHNIKKGFIVYVNTNWIDTYDFKDKTKVKGVPDVKIFNVDISNSGYICIDSNTTTISKISILDGIGYTQSYLQQDRLTPRPEEIDVFGNKAKYSPCNYCYFKDKCNNADKKNMKTFKEMLNG